MPRPLTQIQLDQMRCCSPDGKPQPLYMHGRCHVRAENKVALNKDILSVSCSKCNRAIVEAEIVDNDSFRAAPQGTLGCSHHKDGGLWALYSEGDMFILCAKCNQPVTVLEVRSCPAAESSN